MSYLYTRSLFSICCWFILTPWIFTISDEKGAGLKKGLCANLGGFLELWIVYVILGFNQNWLEMPLMLCHTAAPGFMTGGQWEEHWLLSGINTSCPVLSSISTSCCCPNSCHLSWSLWGSLCEREAVFAWVHVWWIIWTGGIRSFLNQLFLEPLATAYGEGRDCVTSVLLTVLGVTAPAPAQIECDEPHFRPLLVMLAFYLPWVVPKRHEMAVHLLCCRQRAKPLSKGKIGALHSQGLPVYPMPTVLLLQSQVKTYRLVRPESW